MASTARRECYALPSAKKAEVLQRALASPGVMGAVVLSTCGRTEIYVSLAEGAYADPFAFLDAQDEPHETRSGDDCYFHLARLASGALSSIFGEDQILAQVKAALVFAREHGALDSVLEVFFRQAVTAAKAVKTELRFSRGDNNVAAAARDILKKEGDVKNVLVIGNGEIGRLAAETLCAAGFGVAMTLRQYRHTDAVIPEGVEVIRYDDRYARLPAFDAVVSATSSPHCTIEADILRDVSPLPRVFLDLAMPRDIDPDVARLPNVRVLDIDEVSGSGDHDAARRGGLEAMRPILEASLAELKRWDAGREKLTEDPTRTHFPLFVDCGGKTALVVGGGKIAARRVRTLAGFTFDITVVAPEIKDEIRQLADSGRLECRRREFRESDLDKAFLVLAATNDRDVNHRIARLARERGIFASVVDCREEGSFYFPAVAESGRITVGVCGDGTAHPEVVAAAKKIREALADD